MYSDIGSKLGGKISVTNGNGVNIVKLRDKINGFYLGIKGGLVWYFHKNMGMTYELNWQFSLPTNGGSSFNTGFGLAVFGLQWRI